MISVSLKQIGFGIEIRFGFGFGAGSRLGNGNRLRNLFVSTSVLLRLEC